MDELCFDPVLVAGVKGMPAELETYMDDLAADPGSWMNMGINSDGIVPWTSQSRFITDKVTEATWQVQSQYTDPHVGQYRASVILAPNR